MRKPFKQNRYKLLATLIYVFWIGSLAASPVKGYTPLDNLIGSMNLYIQSGQILNVKMGRMLIMQLQRIGVSIVSNDNTTASKLLSGFKQQVSVLGGGIISTSAASQIINDVNNLCVGLTGSVCP